MSNHNKSLSYPKRVAQAYATVFPEYAPLFQHPNHLLGMSYARENERLPHPMDIYTIERQGAQHRDMDVATFASGTAIRHKAIQKEFDILEKSVPKQVFQSLKKAQLHTWDDYFPLLKYKGLTTSIDSLSSIYQMTEGLEYRIKKAATQCSTFDKWLSFLATSRYTKARIQRLSLYLLMNTTNKEMAFAKKNPYIKLLGMNQKGRQWLKETTFSLPKITNVRQQNKALKQLEERYETVYHCFDNSFSFSKDYRPLVIEEE